MSRDLSKSLESGIGRLQDGANWPIDKEAIKRMRRSFRRTAGEAVYTLRDMTADQPLLFTVVAFVIGLFITARRRR